MFYRLELEFPIPLLVLYDTFVQIRYKTSLLMFQMFLVTNFTLIKVSKNKTQKIYTID